MLQDSSTTVQPRILPSEGGAGVPRHFAPVIRRYVVIFQIFMFHVEQFYIYLFFLCVISLKKECYCAESRFTFVNQRIKGVQKEHSKARKHGSTDSFRESTVSAQFFKAVCTDLTLCMIVDYMPSVRQHSKKCGVSPNKLIVNINSHFVNIYCTLLQNLCYICTRKSERLYVAVQHLHQGS